MKLQKLLQALLVFCIMGFSSSASFAQTPLSNPTQDPFSKIAAQEDEFLPVDEAYQWSYSLKDKLLTISWEIADSYYLYEERFKFKIVNGSTPPVSYTPGKLKYDELFERETMVHHHQVSALIDLAGQPAKMDLKFEYQGCAEAGLCYPPQKKQLHIDLTTQQVGPVTESQVPTNTTPSPQDEASAEQPEPSNLLLQAIIFAILGGAILNLMPCVFPVLSIKVMSLASADRDRMHIHGWAYTLGIIVCFVGFALALIIARKGGEAIGWGFQLQSPGLTGTLAYLFFVMGLSMSGIIHFGSSLMGAGQKLTEKSGLTGSFFTGVLAAVVASPCTAPFMGAALGFALTQPTIVSLTVFAALGFGMALPLLLLCYLPALAESLPKPGVWMDNLKQFLAFPLYLSSVWLLWVYGNQTNQSAMAALCIGAICIAFGCWLLGREARGTGKILRNLTIAAAWLIAIFIPMKMLELQQPQTDDDGIHWQAYTPELLQDLRDQGQPVFVNLTADWCLTCLANERVTLHTDTIEKLFRDHKVNALKGDWTNTDPNITALLKEYGRSGVPLYLWFPSGRQGKGDVLPQLLTKDQLIDSIQNSKP